MQPFGVPKGGQVVAEHRTGREEVWGEGQKVPPHLS